MSLPSNPWDDLSPDHRDQVGRMLPVQEQPLRPLASASAGDDIRKLRRYLAYVLIRMDAANRERKEHLQECLRSPFIGSDHPAYTIFQSSTMPPWILHRYLVEAALGKPLEPGQSAESGLRAVYEMMTSGGG